jgi:hypothetical protein
VAGATSAQSRSRDSQPNTSLTTLKELPLTAGQHMSPSSGAHNSSAMAAATGASGRRSGSSAGLAGGGGGGGIKFGIDLPALRELMDHKGSDAIERIRTHYGSIHGLCDALATSPNLGNWALSSLLVKLCATWLGFVCIKVEPFSGDSITRHRRLACFLFHLLLIIQKLGNKKCNGTSDCSCVLCDLQAQRTTTVALVPKSDNSSFGVSQLPSLIYCDDRRSHDLPHLPQFITIRTVLEIAFLLFHHVTLSPFLFRLLLLIRLVSGAFIRLFIHS